MTTPKESLPLDRADNPSAATTPEQGAANVTAGAHANMHAEVASMTGMVKGSPVKAANLDLQSQSTSHNSDQGTQYNHSGLLGALVQNVEYQGIQGITKAVVQGADQIAGTDMASKVHLFDKPLPAEYKSAEWYGEQFGSGLSQIAPFLAALAVTRGACAKVGLDAALEGTAEQGLLLSRNNLLLTGQMGVAGFASSALFTPNEGAKKSFSAFASERAKNGAIGGLDMMAITAGTLSLKSLGASVAKDSPLLGAVFRNTAVGAAITGYPTGALSAQLHAGLFDGRAATKAEMEQSALGMATVGFGLGMIHGKATENAIDRTTNPGISEVLKGKLDRGYQNFDRFVASINPLLANEPRLAYAYGDAGGLRGRAMASTMDDLRSNMMLRDGDETATTSSGRAGKGSRPQKTESLSRVSEREVEDGADIANARPLLEVLKGVHGWEEIYDAVKNNKVLRQQKVVRLLGEGYGNDSPIVLELAPSKAFPTGGALKATVAEGGWMEEWGKRSFDAKMLSDKIPVDLDGSSNGFAGTARVYVQELVDVLPRYDQHLVDAFFEKLRLSGLEFGDRGPDIMKQVGISRRTGELVLIDYPAIDKTGTHETLNKLTEGHAATEEEYDKENADIKAGKGGEEPHDFDKVIDAAAEAERQAAMRGGKFTAQEQELLGQLQEGIPRKEVLEFAALLQGKLKGNGMPDTKAVQPAFDAMVKRAQDAGILEKPGKRAKMGASSDHGDDEDDY